MFHPDCGLWMGATPERLITMSGHHLQTMALAGTRPVAQVNGEIRKGRAGICCSRNYKHLRTIHSK